MMYKGEAVERGPLEQLPLHRGVPVAQAVVLDVHPAVNTGEIQERYRRDIGELRVKEEEEGGAVERGGSWWMV
jgi:hypothetical protein